MKLLIPLLIEEHGLVVSNHMASQYVDVITCSAYCRRGQYVLWYQSLFRFDVYWIQRVSETWWSGSSTICTTTGETCKLYFVLYFEYIDTYKCTMCVHIACVKCSVLWTNRSIRQCYNVIMLLGLDWFDNVSVLVAYFMCDKLSSSL